MPDYLKNNEEKDMSLFDKYNFIAIEGNIGVGKTTICNMIANSYNCKVILESFADNPFLPKFYKAPERYAFPVELFFMTERHKQLQENLLNPSLFKKGTISDYSFIKTLLFAKNNLKSDENHLFQRIFHILNATFPKPDLLVYFHRPINDLLKNIAKRGREYEKNISRVYLQSIQNAYFEYFRTEMTIPILILDIENVDFIKNPKPYPKLLELLEQDYKLGINYVMMNW